MNFNFTDYNNKVNKHIKQSWFKEVEDAINVIGQNFDDNTHYSVYKTSKDVEGIYTVVQYKRSDGTLIMESTLSGGITPKYTTRTELWYDILGTTVIATKVYTLSYDSDDEVMSEVIT